MIWDPYFGWDVYRIRSIFFWTATLCLLISFVASTEGLGWAYPYESLYSWVQNHVEAVLIGFIMVLTSGFYYWKIQSGDI